jgi:nucleotide-binding universal stress UspA family protein
MFQKIALAIAFSPRMEALMCEIKRLSEIFNTEIIFIHIGIQSEKEQVKLDELLVASGFNQSNSRVIWEEGDPTKKIIEICKRENVDLLVTGALKKESFLRMHFSSVARKIMRKAEVSLLILLEPSLQPKSFKRIVINGTDHPRTAEIIEKGLQLAKIEKAQNVHIINEIQMMGLRMSVAGEDTADTVESTRRGLVNDEVVKIEDILKNIDKGNLKINIKIVSGKPGYEMARFAEKVEADLLVLRAPDHKLNLLDRFFPHDLEYILNDLPSNLLIIQPQSS